MKNFIAKVLVLLGVIGMTACQSRAQLIGGYPATNTVSTNSWWLVSDWAGSSNTVAGNRRIDLVKLRTLMQVGVGAGTTWGNTNEVWLAARTDGIAGSGTLPAPWQLCVDRLRISPILMTTAGARLFHNFPARSP